MNIYFLCKTMLAYGIIQCVRNMIVTLLIGLRDLIKSNKNSYSKIRLIRLQFIFESISMTDIYLKIL